MGNINREQTGGLSFSLSQPRHSVALVNAVRGPCWAIHLFGRSNSATLSVISHLSSRFGAEYANPSEEEIITMGRGGHIAHRTKTRTKPCSMPQIPACLFWNKAIIGDAFICLHLQAGSWKRVGRWLSPQSKHEQPSLSTAEKSPRNAPPLW